MAERGIRHHGICTWQPASACEGCPLSGRLKCRFDWGALLHFIALFFGFAIPAIIGVIQGGYGWYLLGWAAYSLIFFELWEGRILCSHCPYYAEDGRVLHCIANYGLFKVWRFHPEPMSKAEKAQLWVGLSILMGFPFPFLLLGRQFAWTLVSLWGAGLFFWTLRRYTCSQCVNFSCPLNTVPQELVDEYLRRNPVMGNAWGKAV